MSVKKTERQSNIELLRIIAIMGVIVLHYNLSGTGSGFDYVAQNSINEIILRFFESLFICAVDLFVLISGYFLIDSQKRNILKPLELIFQTILFAVLYYLVKLIARWEDFSLASFLSKFLLTNYFVVLYVALYLISPFINLIINALSQKGLAYFVLLITVVFMLIPCCVDFMEGISGNSLFGMSPVGAYGSQYGYSIVNFVVMYILGATLKKFDLSKIKLWVLLLTLLAVVLIIFGLSYLEENSAWSYCNPFVAFEAVLFFLIFNKINLGQKKVINYCSRACFTAFLVHSYFIRYTYIEKFVTGNCFLMILHVIGVAVALFLIAVLIYTVYGFCTRPLFGFLGRKFKWTVFVVNSKYETRKDECAPAEMIELTEVETDENEENTDMTDDK